MTWIKTIPLEKADKKLLEALERSKRMYPLEYETPVPALTNNQGQQQAASIVMSHSLIPEALEHAFSTFGALMNPELPLSRKDHELIAATVSSINDCFY